MGKPGAALRGVQPESLETCVQASGEPRRAAAAIGQDDHPDRAGLPVARRLELERPRRRRLLAKRDQDRLEVASRRPSEERERDVEARHATAARELSFPPALELVDGVVGQLEGEEESDGVIPLDGTGWAHVVVCRFSNKRRTRWSAAAVARPRIISRSPGSSVWTAFSPSGPTACT